MNRRDAVKVAATGLAFQTGASAQQRSSAAPVDSLDVRNFGAKGDGETLGTTAINRAIETAAAADPRA